MKKINFALLALSALTVTALAGCNKGQEGPKGPTKWTDEESALLAETLYGETIPFAKGFGAYELDVVNDTYKFINPTVVVNGKKKSATSTRLKDYSKYFKKEEGWVPNTSLMARYKNFFEYEKTVPDEGGVNRYVAVRFYAADYDGEYTSSGKGFLYLQASDPYDYQWPSDFIKENVDYYESEVTVPVISDAERFLYTPGDYSFMAYYVSEEEDGGFSSILTASNPGWKIYSVKDEDGYFIALSPDETFVLSYLYFAKEGLLDIWFLDPSFESWPEAKVQSVFANYSEYGAIEYEVIPFVGGSLYSPGEDSFNAFYIMFGEYEGINAYVEISQISDPDEALTLYLSELGTNGWHYEETESPYDDEDHPNATWYAISKAVDGYSYSMSLEFDAENAYAYLSYYLVPTELPSIDWPADKINAEKPSVVSDTIPSFVGECDGFTFEQNVVTVHVGEEGDVDALIASYVDLLTNESNGYTEVDGYYVSQNGQIKLQIAESEEGFQIAISYLFANETINSVVAEWLTKHEIATDTLPAIDISGAQFEVNRFDEDKLNIIVTGEEVDYAAARDAYVYLLTESGNFDVTYTWSENDKEYSHKTANVSINPYATSGGSSLILAIYTQD